MKIKKLLEEVKQEIKNDDKETAKSILKERLLEIRELKKAIVIMEKQLTELLRKDVRDVV